METESFTFPVSFETQLSGLLKLKFLWWVAAVLMLILPATVVYKNHSRKFRLLNKIPACRANPLVLAIVVLKSIMKNKDVDHNVMFFQLVCGVINIFQASTICLFWIGFRPVVLCYKPEVFEAILKSSVNIHKSFDYHFLSLWLKGGLVTSEGAKWKNRRKLLTPAFHFRILEDFLPIFDEQGRILVSKMKEIVGKEFDIVPYVTLCTLDIVCETAMGIKLHAQRNRESVYVKCMHRVCEAFIARLMRPWQWSDFVYFMTPAGKDFKKNTEAMDKFTKQVIRDRKIEILGKDLPKPAIIDDDMTIYTSSKRRQALLDLLLHHHIVDNTLTEDDIQEEVDSFMFAGHDTTAVGLSWALYLLGLYPDVQKKVQQEIDQVLGDNLDDPITPDDVKEFKYMECVLKETQRVCPSAPFIARELQEDVIVGDYTIPKGTTCMLYTYMLHRNSEAFHNPEVFDPDRFLPDNCIGRHPYAYVPFSAGPRSCIGQKFAMMEEKVLLANVLRHFTVESVDARDKLHMSAEMVLRSRKGLRLRIKNRR